MDIVVDGIKVGAADDIKYVGMWLDKFSAHEKTGGSSVQQDIQK